MKWYEILVEDEFVNYFCDDSNVFTIRINGEEKRAPMFERYYQIVRGVAFGYADRLFDTKTNHHYEVMNPDFRRGFMACSEMEHGKKESIPEIRWAARQKHDEEGISLNELRPEEIAALLVFPFFSRMGGSYEIGFQTSGNLKKYIVALKMKVDEERK